MLGGALSPIDGVDPEDLKIAELFARVTDPGNAIREVVLATNPTTTGEATALHIADVLRERAPDVIVTRLASGLPVGGDLEYADEVTLGKAFSGRRRPVGPSASHCRPADVSADLHGLARVAREGAQLRDPRAARRRSARRDVAAAHGGDDVAVGLVLLRAPAGDDEQVDARLQRLDGGLADRAAGRRGRRDEVGGDDRARRSRAGRAAP